MLKMKKILVFYISFIFILTTIISVVGNNISEEKSNEMIFDYYFSEPIFNSIIENEKTVDRITIETLPNSFHPGIPTLPYKPVKILVPRNEKIKDIKVEIYNRCDYSIPNKIQIGGYLIPLINNQNSKSIESKSIELNIDAYDDSLFTTVGVYNCRGFPILHVNLHPIVYDHTENKISFYDHIRLIVETEKTTNRNFIRALSDDFEIVEKMVDNQVTIDNYKPIAYDKVSFDETYEYIIITSEDFKNYDGENSFQDLIDFKKSKGLTAKIFTIDEIISNSDYQVNGKWGDNNPSNPFYQNPIFDNLSFFDDAPARIRNFIRHAYSELGTKYVLLGGDADVLNQNENILPLRGLFANESGLPLDGLAEEEQDDIPSDVYYACLDGNFNYDCDLHFGESADRNNISEVDEADLYSEVWVGRACVDSEIEISNFVKKTLNYETTSKPYIKEILFVGEHVGFGGIAEWGGNFKDPLEVYIPEKYKLEKFYDRDDPYGSWDAAELIQRLSTNPPHILNHDGHGNHNYILKSHSSSFTEEFLYNEDYFFIYSHSCLTGSFDNYNCWSGYLNDDCIAEVMNCENPYGAFACILNARFGLGAEESLDAPSKEYDESFFIGLFEEDIRELGPANHFSKEYHINSIDENGMRWCYYQTNLFGDPELRIKNPNAPPNKPTIDGPNKVTIGESYDYSISCVDPDQDQLFYRVETYNGGPEFNWEGPYNSGEIVEINITWDKMGFRTLKVTARDTEGVLSPTASMVVFSPKHKNYQFNIFEHLFDFFPFLLKILTLFF